MTEDQISPETITAENDPNSSFWPAWSIFFLGVIFAALNWWRMGNRRKATIFLGIFFGISIINEWLSLHSLTDGIDPDTLNQLTALRLFLNIGAGLALAVLMAKEIKQFQQSGRPPVPTGWTIVFRFFAIFLLVGLGIDTLLYFGPKYSGHCAFPRLTDYIYQNKIAGRSGIEKILLHRNDFQCKVDWRSEWKSTYDYQEDQYNLTHYVLVGRAYFWDGQLEASTILIDQNISLYRRPLSDKDYRQFGPKTGSYPIDALNAKDDVVIAGQNCQKQETFHSNEIRRICIVAFSAGNILVEIVMDAGDNLPNYDVLLQMAVDAAKTRLIQYNQSLTPK
jgi:hypothetical protein